MSERDDDLDGDQFGEGPFAGSPPNWRQGRQRFLVGFLQISFLAVVAAAAAALVLPEPAAHWAAITMTSLLIAVPVIRIAWLLIRWVRLGDWRFALTSAALLGVVGVGALIATLG